MLTIVLLAIVIALLFDFLNGMNDAANSIATIVATRVFSPTMAVCWAAFWNFAAIFIFGVSVAHTMGEGIVDPSKINEYLILAAFPPPFLKAAEAASQVRLCSVRHLKEKAF